MAERNALFCASCGTVSVVEGPCPQCSTPLKKLGRFHGSINESNRSTQMLIDNNNLKASTGSQQAGIHNNGKRSSRIFMDENMPEAYPHDINTAYLFLTYLLITTPY